MTNHATAMSLSAAARIAGLGLLMMVIAAPFAELYVYPKLVVANNAAATAQNIIANEQLFIAAIFCYLITFICDVVVAWALYILLKPVHAPLSLLTAWLRVVYAVVALAALNQLITVLHLLTMPYYSTLFTPNYLHAQAFVYLRAFKSHWYFGIIFFGFHLLLLGYLVFRSGYLPKALGALLIITGIGYLLTSVRPYLLPGINTDFAKYTFYGELIFMFWLLIKGGRIRQDYE